MYVFMNIVDIYIEITLFEYLVENKVFLSM